MAVDNNNRDLVHEVIKENVILQVYKKVDPQTSKVYFDFRVGRIFPTAEGDKTGPYLQQRDIWDLISGSVDLAKWVSEEHRKNRNS